MTAETDLLPLPWQCETAMCPALYTAEQVRACVSSATEALRAEVEMLTKRDAEWNQTAGEEVARAERLAEVLREAREYVVSELAAERDKFAGYEHCSNIASIEADLAKIDAALEQETTNGQ